MPPNCRPPTIGRGTTNKALSMSAQGAQSMLKVGPKPPTEAVRSRSSIEVALERTLGRHLNVDRDARRLRLLDDKPYPVLEVDICILELGLVIEYDGSYWHRGREQHDSRKTARLLVSCVNNSLYML